MPVKASVHGWLVSPGWPDGIVIGKTVAFDALTGGGAVQFEEAGVAWIVP